MHPAPPDAPGFSPELLGRLPRDDDGVLELITTQLAPSSNALNRETIRKLKVHFETLYQTVDAPPARRDTLVLFQDKTAAQMQQMRASVAQDDGIGGGSKVSSGTGENNGGSGGAKTRHDAGHHGP